MDATWDTGLKERIYEAPPSGFGPLISRVMLALCGTAVIAFSIATDDALRSACDFFMRPGAFDKLIPILRTRLQQNVREWGAVAMSSQPFPPIDKEAVAQIKGPILLVSGQHTLPIMRQIDAELRRLLPKAKCVVLEGATHDMINEMPVESSEAIVEFIESTY